MSSSQKSISSSKKIVVRKSKKNFTVVINSKNKDNFIRSGERAIHPRVWELPNRKAFFNWVDNSWLNTLNINGKSFCL